MKVKKGPGPEVKGNANNSGELSKLVDVLHSMLLIRRFEERVADCYRQGLIGGFCHLYIGQEAVACGAYAAIDKAKDRVVTSYRDHAHIILSGREPGPVMAELCGRAGGVSKGKGGSMHLFNPEGNFYGGHGIVGAQVPIGTGFGFVSKYLGDGGVSLVFLGDGAINQGQFAESLNMASLWGLPVIFIVENNEYAMGTSLKRSTGSVDLFRRGEPFGIAGVQVDGMDFFAVRDAVQEACENARLKSMPAVIEAKTYRYRGHSMSDPARYRKREEVDDYRKNHDPILRLKAYMIDANAISNEAFKAMEKDVQAVIDDAVEFALQSPEPSPEELFTEVYPS